MRHFRLLCSALLIALCSSLALMAQDSLRYYRLYLKDKGTPERTLSPADPFYKQATAHLTGRALARRARVLPAGSLVSTSDLPLYPPYLEAIAAAGAEVRQTSRWLNTAMVLADSATYERLRSLPFLDSARMMKARRRTTDIPFGKGSSLVRIQTSPPPADPRSFCITDHYGRADYQNRMTGIDKGHMLGIAGEGVLVGVLDAGFDWRGHAALRHLNVIAEHDFVFNDSNVADEPGEFGAESHGTTVMGMIGGYYQNVLIGGAPHASFILAKTEDIRSERQVEEDNFVAGLEWIESMGADVTNTSLGYTTFDAPERSHDYSELDGRTAHASRGLNHAVSLGVVCVVAAGNEAGRYNYVSVPAEADSAIAVAAVDSSGRVAYFSSRGFGEMTVPGRVRLKPDVAAFGVGNWGADHSDTFRILTGQGTSYASPMVAGAVAMILSARPGLTPYQVRELLYKTSSRATDPDTAVGHGVVNVGRALQELSRSAPVVGLPKVMMFGDHLSIIAGTLFEGGMPMGQFRNDLPLSSYLALTVGVPGGPDTTILQPQPLAGVARWYVPATVRGISLTPEDSVDLMIRYASTGEIVRQGRFGLGASQGTFQVAQGVPDLVTSTLCEIPAMPGTSVAVAVPNPFRQFTMIGFETGDRATVSLTVYNALGQEVARLIDQREMDPGFHTSYFQPAGLPAGSYYYMLQVGEDVRSQQVIYTK